MAVKPVTLLNGQANANRSLQAKWTLANGDTGAPISVPDYEFVSWQVSGVFGTGGAVQFEASLDGTTYGIVGTSAGSGSSGVVAAAAMRCAAQAHRPNCTAGDGSTAIVVVANFQRLPL